MIGLEITGKLNEIDKTLGRLKNKNKQLYSRVSLAENTLQVLTNNLQDTNKTLEEVERQVQRMQKYSRRECIETSEIPVSIINE